MKTDGSEMIRVESIPVDIDGQKIEPEEQATTEAIPVPVDVNLADRATLPHDAPAVGQMQSLVGVASTAGEVARDVATRCELCEHWRHDDWIKHLASIEDTPEGDKQINALRGELLGDRLTETVEGPQGDFKSTRRRAMTEEDWILVNIAIKREFGICAAFTESEGMVVASPFYGGCPTEDPRFKMRDASAQRQASAGYDKILHMAQGRSE